MEKETKQPDVNNPQKPNIIKNFGGLPTWVSITVIALVIVIIGGGIAYGVYQYIDDLKVEDNGLKNVEKTVEIDEFADWETYRNEKYGYEVRYPEEWTIFSALKQKEPDVVLPNSDSSVVKLTDKKEMLFCCEALQTSFKVIEEIVKFENWKEYVTIPDYRIISEREILFKEHKAYEIKSTLGIDSEGGSRLIIVPKENHTILITQGDEGEVWDKITESIKFIEPEIDISSWKTYRNKEYGFEISYPSNLVASADEDSVSIIMPDRKKCGWLTINTENVGRESVFDVNAKTACQILTKEFAGRSAKECVSDLDALYSRDIRIVDIDSINWGVWNELGFYIWRKEECNDLIPIYNQILDSFKFVNISDQAIYRDEEYGFELERPFVHVEYDEIKKEGNKISMCGQYLEVFRKNPTQTLKQAIEEQFLEDYSSDKCWFEEINKTDNSNDYEYATIAFSVSSDDSYWGENRKFCPSRSRSNGVSYFMMDPDYPEKFVFFSIGQAACTTDDGELWQDTFRFVD